MTDFLLVLLLIQYVFGAVLSLKEAIFKVYKTITTI